MRRCVDCENCRCQGRRIWCRADMWGREYTVYDNYIRNDGYPKITGSRVFRQDFGPNRIAQTCPFFVPTSDDVWDHAANVWHTLSAKSEIPDGSKVKGVKPFKIAVPVDSDIWVLTGMQFMRILTSDERGEDQGGDEESREAVPGCAELAQEG